MKALILIFFLRFCLCSNFTLNTTSTTTFEHFWERCVGSGHAALALRADYRKHLELAHKELGFKYVRFHGLFDDDMSVVKKPEDLSLGWKYSFFNIDSIFDFLISIGMKPLIELSFMPIALASGTKTTMHYEGNITPPKSYNDWSDLVTTFTKHIIDRYGEQEVTSWPLEVWNEPNLKDVFWTSTKEEYFRFYEVTARAIKSVNKSLQVGGPSTAGSQWIPDFLKFCREHNVPVDFVSTHTYPTDEQPETRNVLEQITKRTRDQVGDLPLYYTEWNCGLVEMGQGDAFHQDSAYTAPYIVSALGRVGSHVDIFSFWTFSDIFEEQGMPASPYAGTFGMMTKYGTRKASWRAFELLHQSGTKRIKVDGEDSTVDVLATFEDGRIMIFVSNVEVKTKEIKQKTVTLNILGKAPTKPPTLTRVDAENASSYDAWSKMGRPEYPTKDQFRKLEEESQLQYRDVKFEKNVNGISIDVNVPPYGLAVIVYHV